MFPMLLQSPPFARMVFIESPTEELAVSTVRSWAHTQQNPNMREDTMSHWIKLEREQVAIPGQAPCCRHSMLASQWALRSEGPGLLTKAKHLFLSVDRGPLNSPVRQDRGSHFTGVCFPAAVNFPKPSSADDPVHTEVVHAQLWRPKTK